MAQVNLLTETRPSHVHGVGLFATKDIPKDTRIADYQGVEMTIAEFKSRYGNDTRYTYSLGSTQRIIVGKDCLQYNPSHFCNESNDPNVCLKNRGLFTLRYVAKDEELFLKYPKKYPRTYSLSGNTS